MAAAALEQSVLESKDKDTLLEMAKALGVKANARLKKSDIIDKILDTTGPSSGPASSNAPAKSSEAAPGREDRMLRPDRTVSAHRRSLRLNPLQMGSSSVTMASHLLIGRLLCVSKVSIRMSATSARRIMNQSKLKKVTMTVAIETVIATSPMETATVRATAIVVARLEIATATRAVDSLEIKAASNATETMRTAKVVTSAVAAAARAADAALRVLKAKMPRCLTATVSHRVH